MFSFLLPCLFLSTGGLVARRSFVPKWSILLSCLDCSSSYDCWLDRLPRGECFPGSFRLKEQQQARLLSFSLVAHSLLGGQREPTESFLVVATQLLLSNSREIDFWPRAHSRVSWFFPPSPLRSAVLVLYSRVPLKFLLRTFVRPSSLFARLYFGAFAIFVFCGPVLPALLFFPRQTI